MNLSHIIDRVAARVPVVRPITRHGYPGISDELFTELRRLIRKHIDDRDPIKTVLTEIRRDDYVRDMIKSEGVSKKTLMEALQEALTIVWQ